MDTLDGKECKSVVDATGGGLGSLSQEGTASGVGLEVARKACGLQVTLFGLWAGVRSELRTASQVRGCLTSCLCFGGW